MLSKIFLLNGVCVYLCVGEDISVCVCLVILFFCFDLVGKFCNGSLDCRIIFKVEVW